MSSRVLRKSKTGIRRCIADRYLEDTPILARSIPMRTGGQSLSNGASMEPDTLGRAAVLRVHTPIRVDPMQREKCCVSFAITRPPDATQKLQIGESSSVS